MSLVVGGRTGGSQADDRVRRRAEVAIRDGGLARDLAPGVAGGPAPGRVRAHQIEEWLRVSAETGAPLDPLLWADGPLRTTYPACMAVKAAAEQAPTAATPICAGCARRSCASGESSTGRRRWSRRRGSAASTSRGFASTCARMRSRRRSAPTSRRRRRSPRRRPTPTDALSGARRDAAADGRVREGAGGARGRRAAPYDDLRAAALALRRRAAAAPARRLDVERALARFGRLTTREVEVLCDLPGPRAGAELWGLAEAWKVRPVRGLHGAPLGGRLAATPSGSPRESPTRPGGRDAHGADAVGDLADHARAGMMRAQRSPSRRTRRRGPRRSTVRCPC